MRTAAATIACVLLLTRAATAQEAEPAPEAAAESATESESEAEPAAEAAAEPATESESEAEPAAEAAAEPDSEPDLAPEPEPDLAPSSTSSAEAIAAKSRAQREAAFRKQLAAALAERAEVSYTLPWIVTGAGATAILVGAGAGVIRVIDCEGSCSLPFWHSWLPVVGGLLITGGLAWMQDVDAERAAIDSRRHHIEDELRQLRWEQGQSGDGTARSAGGRSGEGTTWAAARVRLTF